MSAWYVGCESLSMLTDIISRYGAAGYNAFGFDLPRELMDNFRGENGWQSEEAIFDKLRQMNIDALKDRYPDDYEEMIDYRGYKEGCDIWQPREMEVQSWHYQLLKSLDCYVYQCSEGNVQDTDLYKGMAKFKMVLAGFIARNQPEYKEAEWK